MPAEGHVPVAAVQRLFAERPSGEFIGMPGMEIADEKGKPFDVIAFAADGRRSVFLAVRPSP